MSGYTDPCDYATSPRSTDPVELLEEEQIRSRWLRQLLAERDTELAERERIVGALLVELAGIAAPAQA
jgi:hypothetical protein